MRAAFAEQPGQALIVKDVVLPVIGPADATNELPTAA